MGWWAANIMGGDTPADIESEILSALGFETHGLFDRFSSVDMSAYTKEELDEITTLFNSELKGLSEAMEEEYHNGDSEDTQNIAYQVLGVNLMRWGATIPPELRARITQAAKEDRWAACQRGIPDGDQDRVEAINSFISDIAKYVDGNPTELTMPDGGLLGRLDQVLEPLEGGGSGVDDLTTLVNRDTNR